jgi:uncharacterized protein YndB with AHSA1/START domain
MNSPTTPATPGTLVSHREFPFPPAAVFAAFADPARLARWWGPAGFSNLIHEFDLRPDGLWRLTMTAPDGTAFENRWRFLAVAPAARVALRHEDPVHRFTLEMLFTPAANAPSASASVTTTQLIWRMTFESAAELARVHAIIAAANEQNFDRLHAHLHAQP